jgi:23S rRNA (uracil1939-C5)-methyltransferase
VAEIHEASPDRVEPPCDHRRAGCGGCDWQHLAGPAQLPAKLSIVLDALRRTAKLPDALVRVGGAVPELAYRTTIRVVGDEERRPAFRVEQSHRTVPATGCMVVDPRLRELLDNVAIEPGLEVTLRVSAATSEATARWDRAGGGVDGLPNWVGVGPDAVVHEVVAGHRLQVSAASFFQSGPAAAELLVDAVRRAAPELDGAGCVLDAYAGVGLFAAASAPSATSLIAVETSRAAVRDCIANLAGRDARVDHGEVGAWRPAPGATIDVAIADPARSGLGRPGVAAVTAARPPVLVLVSCDPVAMARDVGLLAREGYRHDGAEVLDLFPHTHHVEVVTRFIRP